MFEGDLMVQKKGVTVKKEVGDKIIMFQVVYNEMGKQNIVMKEVGGESIVFQVVGFMENERVEVIVEEKKRVLFRWQSQPLNAFTYIKDKDERPKVPHYVFTNEIPVISLSNSHGPERERIRAQLKTASQELGIFQVVDHGVPKDLTTLIMKDAMDFFALPLEEKSQYAMKPGTYLGYGNGSFIKDDPLMDWRELYVTRCLPRETNLWPTKPPTIQKTIADYSDAMVELVRELLELISEALGVELKAIENALGDAEQKLLLNYYPKCPQPEMTLGLKRHTDPGTITLLLQDKVGGLQVTKDDGKTWVTVEPIEGAFVVNLGDQMHVLSNGIFKSADHRAVVNSSTTRLSIVTFHNPNPNSVVYPLDGLVDDEHPTKFQRYIYKEFYARKMTKHIQEREEKLSRRKESCGEDNGTISSL
ncbi:hypothetical protein SUGI_1161240 [Cryptomeria japonica]|nr:hypothetical protein SUGI_1161240 [Cryptomeria japonica]